MLKKLRGGYNILTPGKPSSVVEVLPEPDRLVVPLQSRRFRFTSLAVGHGQHVALGQILAVDPANYRVPLLAPRAGTVDLDALPGHIVLENLSLQPEENGEPETDYIHAARSGGGDARRQELLELGAWQFVADAHTGALPDPMGTPAAVIVSTLRTEPFLAAGNALFGKRQRAFVRGLEHLQSLLEYQPIYVVMPQDQTKGSPRSREDGFAEDILDIIRGYAYVRIVKIPPVYPFDNLAILARNLGLARNAGKPVWGMNVDAMLAIDRALTLSKPCTVRVISLGGPAVNKPRHLKAMAGYPVDSILASRVASGENRVINGGCLTGELLADTRGGLDVECTGLTVLPEHTEREFLGFLRPGADRKSYSRCFLSSITGRIGKVLTTAMNGEPRACVTCGLCEQVCPASVLPWLFHKLAYQNEIEELERARIDLCVECGLCSFVCPSKIDVREEIRAAKAEIELETANGSQRCCS